MLYKPLLNLSSNVFDATQDFVVNFLASGDQVYANEILIQNSSDNTTIWSNKTVVPTFSLLHIIPANTLHNSSSNTYKICVRTYNQAGDMSQYSDFVLFSCYSKQVTDITNVVDNGIIDGQTWTFSSTFYQAEGNLLQSYQYILYDNNHTQIGNSGLLYDGLLQYQFTGFENGKSYSIELQTTTQYNFTTSITKSFTASYISPTSNSFIQLTNNPSQASIDVEIVAIRTLGFVNSGSVSIQDGDWLDARNGVFTTDNAHGLKFKESDWTIQMWVKNITDSNTILILYGENDVTYEIVYKYGRIHLYKYIQGILFSDYSTDDINIETTDVIYIFCQSINNRITIKAEKIN